MTSTAAKYQRMCEKYNDPEKWEQVRFFLVLKNGQEFQISYTFPFVNMENGGNAICFGEYIAPEDIHPDNEPDLSAIFVKGPKHQRFCTGISFMREEISYMVSSVDIHKPYGFDDKR